MTADNPVHRRSIDDDTELLGTWVPIPGLGTLAVNSFIIRAREPVLIDAGIVAMGEPWFATIAAAIDPSEIRWIWLTHTDADHVGALAALLEAAPHARVVTTFLGMAKLGLRAELTPERAWLVNPGQTLDVGDRKLVAVTPPTFDAPETTAVFDGKTRTLFSADCFGAVLSAAAESANDIGDADLDAGLGLWTSVDAPWLGGVRDDAYGAALRRFTALEPATVLSSHLPPAPGMISRLSASLDRARRAPPFVGPDQAALMASHPGA